MHPANDGRPLVGTFGERTGVLECEVAGSAGFGDECFGWLQVDQVGGKVREFGLGEGGPC